MKKLTLILLALFTLPLAAQLEVTPAGPTTDTPVRLVLPVYCGQTIHSHTATRNGAQIVVRTNETFFICDPGFQVGTYVVDLGLLPAGLYDLSLVRNSEPPQAIDTFIVRNSDNARFVVHPFAVPTQLPPVAVIDFPAGNVNCTTNEGCTPHVFLDGVEVPSVIDAATGLIRVTLPAHAEGLVSVRVRYADIDQTLPGALYYFDRAKAPDVDVFERILFPVLYGGGGVNGAQWVSEAAFDNRNPWDIETYNVIDPIACLVPPCSERIRAGEYRKFNGVGHPDGATLLVPRADAEDLSFSLRARDTSRQAKGFGTAIPVVREKDMFRERIALLDVPLDPRFRVKIRAYSYGGALNAVIRKSDGTFAHVPFTRVDGCFERCEVNPIYGELDLAAGAQNERVNVYVDSNEIAWAFATVTNNETQEVTVILPD